MQNISDSEVESKSIDPQTEKNSHSSRRRHYTHLRYTDLQDDVPFEFIPSVSNVPKQIFTCPIEYCRKSFSYRSVRDRHVENIHGFAGSRSKRSLMDDDEIPKKYSRTTDMEIIQDFQDINQQQFIWNELLGVPV